MASTSKQDYEQGHDGLITQVSDHIFELYKPQKGSVQVQIVFFHGLQFGDTSEAYRTTWTNENKILWPATWLPESLPQAHIFSVSYDASMRQSAQQGRLDLHNLAENLATYDIAAAGIGQTPDCPVILVGHCFGGLVMKALCVKAYESHHRHGGNEQMENFLRNLGGVFFYATPHRGYEFPKVLSYFLDGALLEYVTSLNANSTRLHEDFLSACGNLLPDKVMNVGAKNKTQWKLLDAVIVLEASSRFGPRFFTIDADHVTICKPPTKRSHGFKVLLDFILTVKPEDQKLAFRQDFQQLPKSAVGLSLKVKEILKRLDKYRMVGIVGMGGIGKTTLAKAVFNKLCGSFDITCFVPEVKLITGGSMDAKEKACFDLMCFKGKRNPGVEWRGKRMLTIFDDIGGDDDIRVLSKIVDQTSSDSVCVDFSC